MQKPVTVALTSLPFPARRLAAVTLTLAVLVLIASSVDAGRRNPSPANQKDSSPRAYPGGPDFNLAI